jgi:RsmE family RNA methyltransferase
MNIILFEPAEVTVPLSITDGRALHLLQVLRRGVGDSFDAGIVNGPLGKGTLLAIGKDAIELGFEWKDQPPPLDPIALLVGLPRPQTARKLLQEAASMGAASIDFFVSQKGESGYARSRLWSSGEWRRHVIFGAEQAFTTRLPRVSWDMSLSALLATLPAGGSRLALDNYEAACALGDAAVEAPVALALGPERGWSGAERDALRVAGFQLVHLGPRVLRLETACVATLALVKHRLGLL